MKRQMRKAAERVLSILLAVVMIVGMIPMSALAASPAHPDDFTITVKEAGQAVTDVQVAYIITVNDVEQKTGSITAADGIAVITDMAAYAEQIAGGTDTVKIKYTVTKEGYKEVSKEEAVTVANDNLDVSIEKEEPPVPVEEAKVSVESTGNGKIKLNGNEIANGGMIEVEKGSKVSLEVNAGENAFIEKLEIDGKEDLAAKNQTTYSLPDGFAAEKDMTVRVAFAVSKCTVTAETGKGGSVTLMQGANSSQKSITVDKGSQVKVAVKAGEGYQILKVKIGGEEKKDFDGKQSYEMPITVKKDTKVEATFIKIYKVTIKYDKVNGKVITDPVSDSTDEGGTVTVQEGEELTVIATPNENYHISKVLRNGKEAVVENGKEYKDTINVKNTYTYEITFALDQYTITVQVENPEGAEGGSIGWREKTVDFGSKPSLTIKQNTGYHLASIVVNKKTQILEQCLGNGVLAEKQNGEYEFRFNEIKNNVSATVKFEKNEERKATWKPLDGNTFYEISFVDEEGNKVSALSEYGSSKGQSYVLGKDVSVKIVPKIPYTHVGYVTSSNGQPSNPSKEIILPREGNNPTSISKIIVGKGNQGYFEPTEISTSFKVEWDESAPHVDLQIISGSEGKNGYYTGDVTAQLEVKDYVDAGSVGGNSGIAEIMYQITNGTEPVEGKYISIDPEVLQTEIKDSYTKDILVEAKEHNSGDVRIYVKAIDRAGNEYVTKEPYKLKICITAPTVSVSIDGEPDEDAEIPEGNTGYYYNKERTATVTFTDRKDVFDKEAAIAAILIETEGQTPSEQLPTVTWSENEQGDIHTATIKFSSDGKYEWSIGNYENLAGLPNDGITENGESIYSFTVDKLAPITSDSPDKDKTSWIGFEETWWSQLVTTLSFRIWKKHEVKVVASGKDATSGMKEILYYKTDGEDVSEMESMEEIETYLDSCVFQKDPYTVSTDEKFVVYARLTDKAGNTAYIGTNGIIVDKTKPVVKIEPVDEKENKNRGENGYYIDDVRIRVTVDDLQEQKIASGIQKVEYTISSKSLNEIEKDDLYEFKPDDLKQEPLNAWSSDESDSYIKVEAEKFNADDIVVIATVTDNAGNKIDSAPINLQICHVDPKVNIDFSDDYQGQDENRAYFNKEWSAKISITDRNDTFAKKVIFPWTPEEERGNGGLEISVTAKNAEDVVLKDPDTDKEDEFLKKSISVDWTGETEATIKFSQDANYTWSLSYKNKAGRTVEQISYENKRIAPWEITVDQTKPTGNITIDGEKIDETGTKTGAKKTWTDVIEDIKKVLLFGYYSKNDTIVSMAGKDETSKVTLEYLKISDDKLPEMTYVDRDLQKKTFQPYEGPFTISNSEKMVIYLKVTDTAGNYIYVNSDGYIVDRQPSEINLFDLESEDGSFANCYNGDVKVGVEVTEPAPYSGIKEISYKVGYKVWENDENIIQTQSGTLYTLENPTPGQDKLIGKWKSTDTDTEQDQKPPYILVDKNENNSSNVIVEVTVIDNAGNVSRKKCYLDIDITKPEISVEFDKKDEESKEEIMPVNIVKDNGYDRGYFDQTRMATVTIKERSAHFDGEAAKAGIVIKATNSEGIDVPYNEDLVYGEWKTNEGDLLKRKDAIPDDVTHSIDIWYKYDANYDVSISYTDKAGNKNENVNYGSAPTPEHFAVDTTSPEGLITTSILDEGLKKNGKFPGRTTDELEKSLFFGFWAKDAIAITAEAKDETSKGVKIEYYKASGERHTQYLMTAMDLDSVKTWTPLDVNKNKVQVGDEKRVGFTVSKDEKFIVYMKLTDLAGNVTYISSNGMIVDKHKPQVENVAPNVTITPEPSNGIYNKDVRVSIKVVDPEYGQAYSGIKTVKYRVENMGKITQEGVLYSSAQEKSLKHKSRKTWSGSITVKSKLNNSNDVKVRVYAEDNAGNISDYKNRNNKVAMKIDITAPQISVSYNNNSPDSGKYYSSDRVATITVTERNFKEKDVLTTIKNSDGSVPALSAWREVKGTGNGDDTKHIATLTYHADGDYTFGIDYTDLAENKCPGASYVAGTANPTEFTIDQTAPVVTVSYDNNDAQNGKYFKEKRTGTVTITEHNFDESRVEFAQTASLSGGSAAVPQASWSNNGDTHTATFTYDADGDYTFDVTMADMAGNKSAEASYGDTVAGKEFTVDTEISKPQIEGVENGKSYKGDVVPSISYSDVNFAEEEIKLLRTRKDEKDIDVTEQFITGLKANGTGASGINDTFEKIAENDGIYTLSVKISDLAGNEETEEITFTVNRFGSVYVFDEYLVSLKDAYTQVVEKKLVITEYNPDKLKEGSLDIQITRDGTPLNNVKCTVNPVINDKVKVGESGWYQYEYEIDAENFSEDGIYKLIVVSEDTAGNKPETTNFEDGDVLFHVDSTPPEIANITGLEKAVVNGESQSVSFDVFDAIGLKQITVYVDGVEVGTYDQFEDLVNYSGEILLQEGANQEVSLKVEDLAGNITDTNEKNEEGSYTFQPEFSFVRDITISTNAFIRWYANKVLFWGSIGTAAAAAVALFLILFLKRRKKEEA